MKLKSNPSENANASDTVVDRATRLALLDLLERMLQASVSSAMQVSVPSCVSSVGLSRYPASTKQSMHSIFRSKREMRSEILRVAQK